MIPRLIVKGVLLFYPPPFFRIRPTLLCPNIPDSTPNIIFYTIMHGFGIVQFTT